LPALGQSFSPFNVAGAASQRTKSKPAILHAMIVPAKLPAQFATYLAIAGLDCGTVELLLAQLYWKLRNGRRAVVSTEMMTIGHLGVVLTVDSSGRLPRILNVRLPSEDFLCGY